MDDQVIAAWVSDVLRAASDPGACQLPIEHQDPSTRHQRSSILEDTDPKAWQQRALLVDVNKDSDCKVSGSEAQQLDPQTTSPKTSSTSFTDDFDAFDRPSTSWSCRTRSRSSIQRPNDLFKLEKPVTWMTPNPRTLRDAVKGTGSAQALQLFDGIWGVIKGEGYLPRELKGILKEKLMVNNACFAPTDRVVAGNRQEETDCVRQLFPTLDGADEGGMLGRLILHSELRFIRDIVDTTTRFINTTPRSEATWNGHIHGPVLRLAVSSTPYVVAENMAQATIAKAFVPAARGELRTLGGKLIDYVLLLQPEDGLAIRVSRFVSGLDGPRTFNHSTDGPLCCQPTGRCVANRRAAVLPTDGPLCCQPTGALLKTTVDARRRAEAKAQLGIWLAAWYGRVGRFTPSTFEDAGTPPTNLPFLPVLLVMCERWELYFAFDRKGAFEVCGPLEIGSTATVDGSYRLLGVLRLLAGWVAGGFRE